MKKVILYLIVIILLGAVFGWYRYQQQVPTLERVSADFVISADDLFEAFDTDEESALERFEQKVIEVSGTVIEVNELEQGANVTLEAATALMGGVSCAFSDLPASAQIGKEFKCRCRCQGFLMDVILNNCYALE